MDSIACELFYTVAVRHRVLLLQLWLKSWIKLCSASLDFLIRSKPIKGLYLNSNSWPNYVICGKYRRPGQPFRLHQANEIVEKHNHKLCNFWGCCYLTDTKKSGACCCHTSWGHTKELLILAPVIQPIWWWWWEEKPGWLINYSTPLSSLFRLIILSMSIC